MSKIDKEIIDSLDKDPDHAIRLIYKHYRNEFIRWLVSNYKMNNPDAEEIFQDSLVTLYENINQGIVAVFTSKIKTYLFSIGKNKCMDYSKKMKKNVGDFPIESIAKDESDEMIADKNEFEDRLAKVEALLKSLGEPCYPLLKLFYYEKKSWENIAAILNYKDGKSAKNMKYKCMKTIIDRLNKKS